MKLLLQRKVEFMGKHYLLVSSGATAAGSFEGYSRFGGVPITPCLNRPVGWLEADDGFTFLCEDFAGIKDLLEGSAYDLS